MQFQSTLPTRGSDATLGSSTSCPCDFNPRSPRGGATCRFSFNNAFGKFQSTLPTRGSDSIVFLLRNFLVYISIHAPHEGERHILGLITMSEIRISIHAPHEGERLSAANEKIGMIIFQSTLPTRGSDSSKFFFISSYDTISIHAPHEGERHYLQSSL